MKNILSKGAQRVEFFKWKFGQGIAILWNLEKISYNERLGN